MGYAVCILLAVSIGGCGGSGSSGFSGGGSTAAVSYSTTSTKGDYSEWTLSGSQLNATWNVVQDDGTIAYTCNLSATCGGANGFGIRSCTVDSGPCTDGAATCPGNIIGSFDMMEVPGVALFVQTGSGAGGLFKVANPTDSGRIIIAAMKVGDKVVRMGMVYNYRTTSDTNPATGTAFAADVLYNTGNFILFQR